MVLAMSRHMFVRPTFRMDQSAWVAAHRDAFEYFGGVPRRLMPDNLKTGVIKPDIYDPKLNHAYAELAEHYKCLIDPAQAAKPKDKPQVERPMPYVRDSYFAGAGVDRPPPHASRGADLVHRGGRSAIASIARRCPPRSPSSRRSRHRC